jgi:hypothetical protein
MRVICTMNRTALQTISRAQAQAVTMTAQQMLNEVRNDQTMPFDTGNLQNESTYVDDSHIRDGRVTIVSDTPYAKRLYYHPDYHFNTSKNPNAQGEWWEDWLSGRKKNRPKTLFKEFLRRVAGGYIR